MVETPIPKLVVTLSIPTIISMLVSSIYNMADTFFVGRLGTSATGAVGVVFSLMALIQAIGFTLGMGSGNYISRLLGQRNREKAEVVAATGFFTALALGAVLGALGLIFLEPLVRMLGATDTILPYAKDYASYITSVSEVFMQLPSSEDYILSQYDLLAGDFATEEDEIMIVVKEGSLLTDLLLVQLGYFTQEEFLNIIYREHE